MESVYQFLADACFEKGFITIDSDYKVRVSDQAEKDPALYDEISKYDGERNKLTKDKRKQTCKRFFVRAPKQSKLNGRKVKNKKYD